MFWTMKSKPLLTVLLTSHILLTSSLKASEKDVYTLYRNSPIDPTIRIHVATFDNHKEGARYNSENCEIVRDALQKPGVASRFWCENSIESSGLSNLTEKDLKNLLLKFIPVIFDNYYQAGYFLYKDKAKYNGSVNRTYIAVFNINEDANSNKISCEITSKLFTSVDTRFTFGCEKYHNKMKGLKHQT